MSLVPCLFCQKLFDSGERHLCKHANGKLLEAYTCNPHFKTITVKQNGMSQSTFNSTENYNNTNNFRTREMNQNTIFALSTSTSELESIGNPQFATSNPTRAADVINDTSIIPKPIYSEECVSEIVNSQSISIQNEVFSINYDEDIFGDAESVKNMIADILRSDNLSQEQNRVSKNRICPSILNINQSFESLGNEIGVEYNEFAFPNYDETSMAGIPMNRMNPFSMYAQNDQNMFENAHLRNMTPILPFPENESNCILRNNPLNSVKSDATLSISSLHNQAGCTETEEKKQVPGSETTTNGNKSAANNKILINGEEYSQGQRFHESGKSVSTEHFPLFNDSAFHGCSGAQVKECQSPNCLIIPSKMNPSEALFTCKICRKPFSDEASLSDHMLIHSEDRQYNCESCGKIFERKEDVQEHICIHTRNKRYKCDYCDKEFKFNYVLKRHIRTHTGEKPYKCENCGKTFRYQSNKKVHIRTHTGEKPYECKHCKRTFSHKHRLQTHTLTHTGEKPYKCEYCGKTFRYQSYKKVHIRTHTGEKPYKCRTCGRVFAHQQHLKRHKCIQKGF